MRRTGVFLLLFSLLFIISGCGSHSLSKRRTTRSGFTDRRPVGPDEAKLMDVPFVIGANFVPPLLNDPSLDTIELVYTSERLYDDVITFYNHGMERAGWRQVKAFVGDEAIMVFEKPTRICVVMIRDERSKRRKNDQRLVRVLVSQKNSV